MEEGEHVCFLPGTGIRVGGKVGTGKDAKLLQCDGDDACQGEYLPLYVCMYVPKYSGIVGGFRCGGHHAAVDHSMTDLHVCLYYLQ
jgi:hypothetical protein